MILKIYMHHMFGYPDLDAGLNTTQLGGDIAFSIRQHRPRLAKPCLRHFKSGDGLATSLSLFSAYVVRAREMEGARDLLDQEIEIETVTQRSR